MIYQELNPCVCGESEFRDSGGELLDGPDGSFIRRRVGNCAGCGTPREFIFGLPDIAVSGGESWEMFFGGPEPSQLIDAGEWLTVTHNLAKSIPADPAPDLQERRRQQEILTMAVAAMNEVLKFIGPDRFDDAPDAAFWTARGRAKRADPAVGFMRGRLVAYRGGLLKALERLGGAYYEGRPITGRMQ